MDRENKEIDAVHERDLDNLLQKLGIKEKFDSGEFRCKFCKDVVGQQNLYSILPESGGVNFICDKPVCVVAFTEYNADKERNKTD